MNINSLISHHIPYSPAPKISRSLPRLLQFGHPRQTHQAQHPQGAEEARGLQTRLAEATEATTGHVETVGF
jgi:hypothetical protein